MSTLTGNLIASTYPSLLKTADNQPIGTASLKNITDGIGNPTPIFISTGSVYISGTLQTTASQALAALYVDSTNVEGPYGMDSVTSASYAVTASYALNGGGGGPIHVPFMRNQTDPLGENTILQHESIFNPANLSVLDSTTFTTEADSTYYILGDLINSGSIIVSGTIHIEGALLNNGSIVGPGIIE